MYQDPVDLHQQMEYQRQQMIKKAVETIDWKIMETSDGSAEITDFLTGIATLKLVHRSVQTLLPSGWQMPAYICEVEGLSPKMMAEIEAGIAEGLTIINQAENTDDILRSHLITELAWEFVGKVRLATRGKLLSQDIQKTHE